MNMCDLMENIINHHIAICHSRASFYIDMYYRWHVTQSLFEGLDVREI